MGSIQNNQYRARGVRNGDTRFRTSNWASFASFGLIRKIQQCEREEVCIASSHCAGFVPEDQRCPHISPRSCRRRFLAASPPNLEGGYPQMARQCRLGDPAWQNYYPHRPFSYSAKDRIIDAESEDRLEAEVLKSSKEPTISLPAIVTRSHRRSPVHRQTFWCQGGSWSRTTVNLMLTAEVNPSQLVTIGGGESLNRKRFFRAGYREPARWMSRNGKELQPQSEEEHLEPKSRPLLGRDFVEGKVFSTTLPLVSIESYTRAPATLSKRISRITAETILMAAVQGYDLPNVLTILIPKTSIHHHFNSGRRHLQKGFKNQYQTDRPLRP